MFPIPEGASPGTFLVVISASGKNFNWDLKAVNFDLLTEILFFTTNVASHN